jgi:glutathione S-transferase
MTITLYAAPGSCAVAPAIALCEAGADFEIHAVDYSRQEQRSAAFLSINPKGRTPALVTDEGVLTENPAILAYIAQLFPAAGLAPIHDLFAFAKLNAFNAWLCSTLHPAYAHILRAERYADGDDHQAAVRRKGIEQVDNAFQIAETELFQGPWAMGDAYTTADAYLYVLTRWLPRAAFRQVNAYPKIADHFERMRARPAVSEAHRRLGMATP